MVETGRSFIKADCRSPQPCPPPPSGGGCTRLDGAPVVRGHLFEGATRQHPRQMPAVLRRAVQILLGIGALCSLLRGGPQFVIVAGLSAQRLLDTECSQRLVSHTGQADCDVLDLVATD